LNGHVQAKKEQRAAWEAGVQLFRPVPLPYLLIPAKSERVMNAMLQIDKLDIKTLEQAYHFPESIR
jgi:hypothetical protein